MSENKTSSMPSTLKLVLISCFATLIIAILLLSIGIYVLEPVSEIANRLIAAGISQSEVQQVVELAQSNIYEAVISFLVFANGVIVALSVWYIKTNSHERAEALIDERAKKYFEGLEFKKLVQEEVEQRGREYLELAQGDMQETSTLFEKAYSDFTSKSNQIDSNYHRIQELERNVRIIAATVADLDSIETEGSELRLEKEN
ncbi:hypothetical protein [Alteromonas flava]|uniref:hypothetical protein n=1 Tax=Alteromonas flava TaxID=2048003 RepID=UPI000F5DF645|nr:hypothetical protein [Alteromonas flava]